MNPEKRKNKRYPITYVGHCDFDYHLSPYPCQVVYPQGECIPIKPGNIGSCVSARGKRKDFNQFGFFIPFLIGLGFTGLAGYLYTRLKEARTQEQKESVKSDAYKAYRNGEITLEEYKTLLALQEGANIEPGYEDYISDLVFKNFFKKYKILLIGGGFFMLMFMILLIKK